MDEKELFELMIGQEIERVYVKKVKEDGDANISSIKICLGNHKSIKLSSLDGFVTFGLIPVRTPIIKVEVGDWELIEGKE